MMKTMSFLRLIVLFLCSGSFCLAQKNIVFRSFIDYAATLNDVWGYADTAGREYAFVGMKTGTSIVNVTDPDSAYELFFIPGAVSTWRDIKTWDRYAYVVHDHTDNDTTDGLLIIDLGYLPDSITTSYWRGGTLDFQQAHNLWIDENGFCYLFGSNTGGGGAAILDLSDPVNPIYAGNYGANYVHDGFVRGDTLWTSEIYKGWFGVIDVSDKTNPALLTTMSTPDKFTHNCWLSDDGTTLFTTDEASGAYVTSYDVSDIQNIKELDRYQSGPGSMVIPHNTHFYNNYLVTSYYRNGVTIVDAAKPDNLIEVAYFDTSPLEADAGYEGCWGAYPFLPSGTLLASDRQEGLFVLTPTYTRACYLEGTVMDTAGNPLSNITVAILGVEYTDQSKITGKYAIGTPDSGEYDIRFYNKVCETQIIKNVLLQPGLTTTLNITMQCSGNTYNYALYNNDKYMLNVYPTFFSDHLNMNYRIRHGSEPILSIIDARGAPLYTGQLHDKEDRLVIYTEEWPAGMYMVRLKGYDLNKTVKIVKLN